MTFKRVGILSIGEMGLHWAYLLRDHGVEVLTYLKRRSEATRKRAERAGVRPVSSLARLAAESDLVVSLVIPSAARRVATKVAEGLAKVEKKSLFYLDANAISPMTAKAIERDLSRVHARFIDGCLIGSAAKLDQGTVLYVSGPQAEQIRALERFGFSVRILGPSIGQASAFKIVYAGLTKGLQGLLVELLIGARNFGLLDGILRRYDESFPGLVDRIGQSIAALPLHAGRRAEEMAELSQTFRHHGLRALMAPATEKILRRIAHLNLRSPADTKAGQRALLETLELFFQRGLLRETVASQNSSKNDLSRRKRVGGE